MQVEKHQAKTKEAPVMPKDDLVRIIFHNLTDRDSKGNNLPLEFHYNGVQYKLFHSKEAVMPREVAKHLQGLSYPVYDYVDDPHEPGSKICAQVGETKRFNVVILGEA